MAPAASTVTVMSFNTHHRQGAHGVLDLVRIAAVIRASRADIPGRPGDH